MNKQAAREFKEYMSEAGGTIEESDDCLRLSEFNLPDKHEDEEGLTWMNDLERKNTIARMKLNTTITDLLDEDELDALDYAGKENCVVYDCGKWVPLAPKWVPLAPLSPFAFCSSDVYRIKKDYKYVEKSPYIIKHKVIEQDGYYCFKHRGRNEDIMNAANIVGYLGVDYIEVDIGHDGYIERIPQCVIFKA